MEAKQKVAQAHLAVKEEERQKVLSGRTGLPKSREEAAAADAKRMTDGIRMISLCVKCVFAAGLTRCFAC